MYHLSHIQRVLREPYRPTTAIDTLRNLQLPMGQVATTVMGMGHVELGMAMVGAGIEPLPLTGTLAAAYTVQGSRHVPQVGLMGVLTIPHASYHNEINPQVKRQREVLDHLLANPHPWPLGINDFIHDRTPLMHLLAGGGTPLDPTDEDEFPYMLQALVKLGADPKLSSSLHTALSAAAGSLRNGVARGPLDTTVKRRAAREQQLDEYRSMLMDIIVGWGVDPDKDGHIALARSLRADHFLRLYRKDNPWTLPPTWALLQERGTTLQSPTRCPQEVNPFAVAVELGEIGALRALLDAGLDPAWLDTQTGQSLFSLAATASNGIPREAMRIIPPRQMQAVANTPNHRGNPPLHLAVASMRPELVEDLLACGADPNMCNAQGKLPLETVKRSGPKALRHMARIGQLLETAGGVLMGGRGNPTDLLFQACKALSVDTAEKCLDQGADLARKDRHGLTPLLRAVASMTSQAMDRNTQQAMAAQTKLVQLLLARGADPQALDGEGNTALHLATASTLHLLVPLLMDTGIDIMARNMKGQTPMHTLSWRAYQFNKVQQPLLSIFEAFASRGADLFAKDNEGVLPFATMRKMMHEFPQIVAHLDRQVLDTTTHAAQAGGQPRIRL